MSEAQEFHYHRITPLADGRYQVNSPRGIQWISASLEQARAQVLESMAYSDAQPAL
ncbi:hypothetical protein [Vulcanococcus sp.]|uniref:hypothetical protein n=1 Tax=Vulcanococcus sp. TaxID=2856995 RepID=UPI003C0A7EFD